MPGVSRTVLSKALQPSGSPFRPGEWEDSPPLAGMLRDSPGSVAL